MMFKRYEYWSNEGKVWTDWFPWNSNYKPELQMDDRRIFCRLKNEYKENQIMKVFVQVIDTKTAVYQHGMIEEPVIKGSEIINALKHFGVIYGEVEWHNDVIEGNFENTRIMIGNITGTTKIVNVVAL